MLSQQLKNPKNKPVLIFISKAVLLYIFWFITYDFIIAPDSRLDSWLNERVAKDARLILNAGGFDADTRPGDRQTLITITGKEMVGVGNPCNGLELFALFTGFVICFPGPWKHKVWFIPAGILGIHLINTMRAAALALIQFKVPEYLDFNHHYTFTIIVYAFIFLLWMIWTNRYGQIKKAHPTTHAE